jgi:lysophospholipase L1-like esterase
MKTRIGIALGLLLSATACTTPPAPGADDGPRLGEVLFVGDSVAAGESAPLTEAFAASDVHFRSIASEGGGNVVGPNSEATWQRLGAAIKEGTPSVVIYQITTYDWGTPQEQKDAYTRLSTTVTAAGATLVLITMPPIKPDDFYAPHMEDLNRTRDAARTVASASAGRANLLDAHEVWGDEYQQQRNGKADRSSDGIHTCPQGAARFTAWLLTELARIRPSFTPAPPGTWANTGWSADKRFVGC